MCLVFFRTNNEKDLDYGSGNVRLTYKMGVIFYGIVSYDQPLHPPVIKPQSDLIYIFLKNLPYRYLIILFRNRLFQSEPFFQHLLQAGKILVRI
jgi:hypothetical protein